MPTIFDPNNMHPDLREFLEKNDALSAFIHNYNTKNRDLDSELNSIDQAFSWAKTPQKFAYWSKLDSEYIEIKHAKRKERKRSYA